MLFNTPADIFNLSKEYLLMLMFFYPLNCYILVISFFIRSDGFPKMPFYAVLMANILNILFDIIFLKVFNLSVVYTALASTLGYLIGAIYISSYLFKKHGSFKIISLAKFKIKDIVFSIKEFVLNTPEVIGKVFFVVKTSLLTYLCSTYLGVAGLVAFLVYDNSETFVYMFLSGIMKTMSPIVTVLHKERDAEAVRYIILHSIKHVLLISFPVSIVLFVYPEILLSIFNIVNPYHVKVVTLAIRLTAFSLVGRCIAYLLANYAQAIERNGISFTITCLEEFIFAISGALILTEAVGGVGIWISILVAECLPVIIYLIYSHNAKKNNIDELDALFMLHNSNLITWTYNINDVGNIDKYLDDEFADLLRNIENVLNDTAVIISNSMDSICNDIFENSNVEDIDITIRLIGEDLYIALTSEGMLYNPFSNEDLMKSDNLVKLSKLNCELDYTEILGFNKTYIIFKS